MARAEQQIPLPTKTQIIGEFQQQDGWHPTLTFLSTSEAKVWMYSVNAAGGHHHARRYRRVKIGSGAWSVAIDAEVSQSR